MRKLDIAIDLVLASIDVPGGVLLILAGFSALKNDPSRISRWVVGISLLFLGLIGLLLGLSFLLRCVTLLTGKSTLKIRDLTIRVGRSRK